MVWAFLTGRSTVSGFDLARFSSLSSKHLCVSSLCGAIYIQKNFCLLHSSLYLLLSYAWWDWPLTWLTNHCPSVLWHCWFGCLTCKIVHEMTYKVSSGTLNPTILNYTDDVEPAFLPVSGKYLVVVRHCLSTFGHQAFLLLDWWSGLWNSLSHGLRDLGSHSQKSQKSNLGWSFS